MRQIILDTETTGISPENGHRVIEIGCLEMIDRKLTGNKFHTYLNPQREVDAGAVAVHGLKNQFLEDKPLFKDVVESFMDFISGSELIIHNAPFDVGFLDHELRLTKQTWKAIADYCAVIDTLKLARQKHAGQRNTLDALCKRYTVDNSKRDFHGALLDAYLLAQVYLAMTGGQGNLFDTPTMATRNTLKQQVSHTPLEKTYALKIKTASEEELTAHHNYIELLRKRGKCLWNQE